MDKFSFFYKPEEPGDLWETAKVAIDANVLLHLHRYPKDTRTHLFEILQTLKERGQLLVPHQAALEYHSLRDEVIAEQYKQLSAFEKQVEERFSALLEWSRQARLHTQHRTFDFRGFEKRLRGFQKREASKIQHNFDELEKTEIDFFDVKALLDGCLSTELDSDEWKSISTDGKERYALKIPPGYKDQGKSDKDNGGKTNKKSHRLLLWQDPPFKYDPQYGDLILWRQLLRDCKGKSLILVTDDQKEDWVEKVSGNHLPRVELCQEAHAKGIEHFKISTTTGLLRQSEKLTGRSINAEDLSVAEHYRATSPKISRSAIDALKRLKDELVPLSEELSVNAQSFASFLDREMPDVREANQIAKTLLAIRNQAAHRASWQLEGADDSEDEAF